VDPTQANDVGGRQKGTPNRHTRTVQEKLEAVGCDPIEGMARLAMDEQTDLAIRARLYAELAQYVAPKRKALDVTVEDQRPPYAELLDLMRSGKLNEVAATTGWQPQTHPLRERNEG